MKLSISPLKQQLHHNIGGSSISHSFKPSDVIFFYATFLCFFFFRAVVAPKLKHSWFSPEFGMRLSTSQILETL